MKPMPGVSKTPDPKEEKVRVDGVVLSVLPDTKYRVKVDIQGLAHELTGYISGKMRQHYIKIAEGDKVIVEISPYNLDVGRIVYKIDRRRQMMAAAQKK